MAKVCVLLADGFEELEAVTLIDVLRRAGAEVTTLAVTNPNVRGAHGIVMHADANLAEHQNTPWDAVLLPGGMPGAATLRDTPLVQELVQKQAKRQGLVGAICAAPIALAQAGLLDGKRCTCYPGFEKEVERGGAKVHEQAVVDEGAVLTSRGPGTAMQFALTLAERLCGKSKAEGVAKDMLVV